MPEVSNKHAQLDKAVASGQQRHADPRIGLSWRRCLQEYGLDPASDSSVDCVSHSQLQERQEKLAALLAPAQLEITNLQRYTAGSHHSLLVVDAQGVILNYAGGADFNTIAKKLGLRLGALWAESNQGTNAIGTCLHDNDAVIVSGQAHFFTRNHIVAAAAAPILDPQGQLIATLAAYSQPAYINEHTLILMKICAEQIENRYLLAQTTDALPLRFHSQPGGIGSLGEGLLSLNTDGRILAANRSAAYQLGYDSVAALLNRDVGELFNISAEALANLAASNGLQKLYETGHGRRFYARLQAQADRIKQHESASGRILSSGSTASTGATLEELNHGDPAMAANIRCARRILTHDIPVMLYGETGTGKELFAKALHCASERASGPYVAVNCASIPETLIESELFGYRGGAFTGARREGSRGKIAQADGGTLFLDEIGDMPLALQGRLLRVLEEREVLPLGSDTPVKVDIRLISATHRDLPTLIAEGQFREDLYYRLQGISMTLPPLRERHDKRNLIEHVLALENAGTPVPIEATAMRELENYSWPGNLRQLGNVLRTMLVLRDGDTITCADLPADIRQKTTAIRHESNVGKTPQYNPLKSAERDALLQALEQDYWNITRVARRFAVSRNTIYRKMRAFEINPPN